MTNISDVLTKAINDVKTYENTLPQEYRDAFNQALEDMVHLIEQEIDAAISSYTSKIPVVGGIAKSIMEKGANDALQAAIDELNAAKTQTGATS